MCADGRGDRWTPAPRQGHAWRQPVEIPCGAPRMTEVLVEKRGLVQWITINREERRNAMNDAVVFGIMDGLTAATADPEIRAVVLTGAGDRAFCAGADLTAHSGSFKFDYSKVGIPFVKLMKQARDLTLPFIARVN